MTNKCEHLALAIACPRLLEKCHRGRNWTRAPFSLVKDFILWILYLYWLPQSIWIATLESGWRNNSLQLEKRLDGWVGQCRPCRSLSFGEVAQGYVTLWWYQVLSIGQCSTSWWWYESSQPALTCGSRGRFFWARKGGASACDHLVITSAACLLSRSSQSSQWHDQRISPVPTITSPPPPPHHHHHHHQSEICTPGVRCSCHYHRLQPAMY